MDHNEYFCPMHVVQHAPPDHLIVEISVNIENQI